MTRQFFILCLLVLWLLAIPAADLTARFRKSTPTTQPRSISYWGMNLYLTKRERISAHDNLPLLARMGRDAGMQWTREELPWDLIEPQDERFLSVYDASLKLAADNGFGIIGMLLTTPAWARDPTCRPPGPAYWCPPSDIQQYARFAGWMAERYDGDGYMDAPGSPRIAAWEIWNEPNDTVLWPNIGSDDSVRKRRYGEMMVAAYAAIKAADPTATVLTGGTYIFDGGCWQVCDGMNFFNASGGVFPQIPAARQAFDVFAIHPFIPTAPPDGATLVPRITVEGRIRTTRGWLDYDIGRPDAPVWVTEMGWCTTGGKCPADVPVTEDQQANFLVRSMVIAQQNGVQHTSWFQFEDAFNDPNREWSNAAIVHTYTGSAYPPKPAYTAYQTLAEQLQDAIAAGPGPLYRHIYRPNADQGDPNDVYDYRYTRGQATIDVLWRPAGSSSAFFPVVPGNVISRVDRDGTTTQLTSVNGTVVLNLGERPVIIVQQEPAAPPRLHLSSTSLLFLAQPDTTTVSGVISITNSGGGILRWSAGTATSWLTLTPDSGRAPSILTVRADIRGWTLGTYRASIRITGSGDAGTVDMPVEVRVVPRVYRTFLPSIDH